MTEAYCGHGFEADQQYCGLLRFSTHEMRPRSGGYILDRGSPAGNQKAIGPISKKNSRDFFEPQIARRLVLGTLQKAQRMISGCEACSEDAEIPSDNILDRLTGSDPSVTDYVLEVAARCSQCGAEINEKTLVEWNPE